MLPANDAAGQFQESFVNESEAFKADAQTPEVVKLGDGPLYDPTCFAEPTTMRLGTPCNFSCNAGRM